jgi:hypothetical protein
VNFAKLNEAFMKWKTMMTEHELAAAVSVDDVRAIMAAVIKKAQGGDVAAAKFVLDRADNDARIAACDEGDWAELLGGKKKSDVA